MSLRERRPARPPARVGSNASRPAWPLLSALIDSLRRPFPIPGYATVASVVLVSLLAHFLATSPAPPPPPPPPTLVCPAPPMLPQADAFDWMFQLPRLCPRLDGAQMHPWTLFGTPVNLTDSWQNARAPNSTESRACLRAVRKGYRRVRALWHPDRVAKPPTSTAPGGPQSTPGLRAVFNLSERHLLIVAGVLDDAYTAARFQCLQNEQKSRYLDVLADGEDLDVDDMMDDGPVSPDEAMDMDDHDYFKLIFMAERLSKPFHTVADCFRQLRRSSRGWFGFGDQDFFDWEEERRKIDQEVERSVRRNRHLAWLMGDSLLKGGLGPEWEKERRRPESS
ncbi:uncharacterized protein J3D65DRAFT_666717 [Phyllosticta citribraziliensis]|uniref:J domain-containing protein n=1 Tax=Phyllosticta citribraziliensis TaxID=989973 RepID=A0ABR1M169_9PEZI